MTVRMKDTNDGRRMMTSSGRAKVTVEDVSLFWGTTAIAKSRSNGLLAGWQQSSDNSQARSLQIMINWTENYVEADIHSKKRFLAIGRDRRKRVSFG